MEGVSKKSVFGFRILPSFWVLALMSVLTKNGFLFCLYTISVLIHEFAHFFVAKKLRYKCNSIKLSVFGAVLYGDFDDISALDSIKIAIAGPSTNGIIALLTVALWWIFPSSYVFTVDFVFCNVALLALNLMPCYPLDGGRVFVALLQKKYGFANGLKLSKMLSTVLAFSFFAVFIIGFVFGKSFFSIGLFGFFLLLSSSNDYSRAVFVRQTIFEGYKKSAKRGLEKKCLVFDGEVTLNNVLKKLNDNFYYEITVLNGENTFSLTQPQINKCLLLCPLDTPLKYLLKYKI